MPDMSLLKMPTMPLESEFTAPHRACPHPEYWHAPDNDSSEVEVSELVGALVRAIQPELVIETGTAYGYTAREIARALTRNGHGRLISLDVDADRIAYAEQLLEAAVTEHSVERARFEMRRQSSLDYMPSEPIHFAWFDSLYELRAQEFKRYRASDQLRAGTIVGFHDWTSGLRGHYMDVRKEVEGLAYEGWLRPIFIPTPRGVVLAEVL